MYGGGGNFWFVVVEIFEGPDSLALIYLTFSILIFQHCSRAICPILVSSSADGVSHYDFALGVGYIKICLL